MSVPHPNGRSAAAQRGSNPHWLVATAGAVAMLAATLPALAQTQVGGNGHLNDANNGVGSGGYNPASNPNNRGTSGTQVLTDDSTGLSGFHGNSQVDDPNVFQGGNPNAGFDRFNAVAAPVNYAGPSNGSPAYSSFYSKQTYTAQPPPNFTTTANGSGYVPAAAAAAQRGNPGAPGTVGQVETVNGPAANQPLYAMSPLYGVREVQAAGADDGNTAAAIASPSRTVKPALPSSGALALGSPGPEAPPAIDQPSALIAALRQRFLAGADGAGGARAAPVGGDITTFGTPPPTPSTKPADQPFLITSLASGIRDKGLAGLLRSAEDQMRSGQFGQAIYTYDAAGEVAPNNPFIPLGRGFAELGAGYYGQAEADLTRAILTEPAVLAAQYDLKGFLGQDRLRFVQKDLTDIGTTEATARPYLLLAYIDHNTGADDVTVTATDLETAETRGANERVVTLMREAWNLRSARRN